MSDLKIAEFRERAEVGLDIPDLAEIERRGDALRRRRVAAAAGGLALVLLAGAGIANLATDVDDAAPEPAAPPSPAPSSSWDDDLRLRIDQGEEVLLPGRSKVVFDEVTASFDVPGENWEWWRSGMGLRPNATAVDHYAATVFFLPEATARLQPCSDKRVEPLGNDPDDLDGNVEPLLDLAHSTVLQRPRVVAALGGTAVHLRLQTNGSCPAGWGIPLQLTGTVNGSTVEPGWSGRRVLDLWHVVGDGPEPASLLVASWQLAGTAEHRDEHQALLDSIQVDVD
jgi:hypothetical protein